MIVMACLTCFEDIPTAITARGKLCIIAGPAVDTVCLGPKLLVHQAGPALVAEEAGLVPVLLLVGQVLHRCLVNHIKMHLG